MADAAIPRARVVNSGGPAVGVDAATDYNRDRRGKRCLVCHRLVPRVCHMTHQRSCMAGFVEARPQPHIGIDADGNPADLLTAMVPTWLATKFEKLAKRVFSGYIDSGDDAGLRPGCRGACYGFGWDWQNNVMFGPPGTFDAFKEDVQNAAADLLNLDLMKVGWAPGLARRMPTPGGPGRMHARPGYGYPGRAPRARYVCREP